MPGWKDEIDGNKTKSDKANHGFMGIIVTKGKHAGRFYYAPESFLISKYIVLFLSSAVLLGIIFISVRKYSGKSNDITLERREGLAPKS